MGLFTAVWPQLIVLNNFALIFIGIALLKIESTLKY